MLSKFISKVVGEKGKWREYKARTSELPEDYRTTVDAIERYLMHFGPIDSRSATSVFDVVIDLFEQAAADGTPIGDVVGDDPVKFVETLIQNYSKGGYVDRERERLVNSVDRAARNQARKKQKENGTKS